MTILAFFAGFVIGVVVTIGVIGAVYEVSRLDV